MSLIAKEPEGGDFVLVSQGTHIAICNMVVDIGIQQTGFGPKHKVYLRWELPNERTEDDKPMVIGQFYTVSLSVKSNLRGDLESWRGKQFTKEELEGFDLKKVLGAPCQITVLHNRVDKKTYANVTAVVSFPKGMPRPTPENDLIAYDNDDPINLDKLPEWLQKKISGQTREEVHEEVRGESQNDNEPFNDDIPW